MKFITVATHSQGYYPFLLESCKRYNVDLAVVGWNKKWTGFLCKFTWVLEYIQDLPDDEVMCVLDAYDVILAKPVGDLEGLFLAIHGAMSARIIVGCDLHNTHFTKWVTPFIFGKCHNKQLNAGVYIGFVKDIRTMLQTILNERQSHETDDQALMTRYCREKPNILVDCDRLISISACNPFSDVFKMDGASFENGSYVYKGTAPFIVHAPGNTSLIPLLEKQGYTIDTEERDRLVRYHRDVFKKGLIYVKWSWIAVVVTTIVLIVLLVQAIRTLR